MNDQYIPKVLSKEKMQSLKELGIDTSDASCCYDSEGWVRHMNSYFYYNIGNGITPAYNIEDLLKKIPVGASIERHYLVNHDTYIVKFGEVFAYTNKSLLKALYELICYFYRNKK